MGAFGNSHRLPKFEKLIGEKVKVTFKNGSGCIGVLEHLGWKYAMKPCWWFNTSNSEEDHEVTSWFLFCFTNVKSIQKYEEE